MLKITTEFRKGILFVRLKGNLDKTTVYKLDSKVTEIVKECGVRNIVFNFTDLKFIDFKGINSILFNYELCKNNKGKSMFCGNNDYIRDKLKKSRLINYIYEVHDEVNAIKLLNLR